MHESHGTNSLAHVPGREGELNATSSPQTPPAELWEAWRMAQAGCELALNNWYAASKGNKARGFAAYIAALELEEQAADALALVRADGATAGA